MAMSTLPEDSAARKALPIYSGVVRYFPRALAYVAHVSKIGNDKHNPNQPLQWAREKSNDHHDAAMRHLMESGGVDEHGVRHSGYLAWRALAILELELEAASLVQTLQDRACVRIPVGEIPYQKRVSDK